MTTAERVYQTTDLTSATRKDFIAAAQASRARLRTPDGDLLVLVRDELIERLSRLADDGVNLAMLENALGRPRDQRTVADFGHWAFIAVFDDEDINAFRTEVVEGLVLSAARQDSGALDEVIDAWRLSARTLEDEVAREILTGEVAAEDWLEAAPPVPGD